MFMSRPSPRIARVPGRGGLATKRSVAVVAAARVSPAASPAGIPPFTRAPREKGKAAQFACEKETTDREAFLQFQFVHTTPQPAHAWLALLAPAAAEPAERCPCVR